MSATLSKTSYKRIKLSLILAGLLTLLIWPFIGDSTPIYTSLAIEMLIFGLFGLAYNLALGYTGLVSLGHACLFGVGGYTAGAFLKFYNVPVLVGFAGGVLASCLMAIIMGYICLRKSGVYFSLITLAISQMMYYVAQMWEHVTGGHEGMIGIPRLSLFSSIELTHNPNVQYWFVASVSVICAAVLWRIVNSPFGRVLMAIRENEERAETCGFNTQRVKLIVFTISGAFSGVAGSLYVVFLEFFGIESIHWPMSGIVLIITLFGGTEVFLGPFVGAIIFSLLKDSLSVYFEYWQLMTGMLFLAIVMFLPQGIVGSMVQVIKSGEIQRQFNISGSANS